ncbi:MAG: dihydrofolate reductase [Alphaproteobacteria bacterium]
MVSIIAAVAENGVIGCDGDLPWRLSSDLRRFKEITLGKPVVMGRKTWDSIGRPLPGRANIVVSGNADFVAEGADVAADIDAAFDIACRRAAQTGADEVFVIGGAALYEAALGLAGRLYLTEVQAAVSGDTHFPDVDRALWREIARETRPAGEKDDHPHAFVTLERVD